MSGVSTYRVVGGGGVYVPLKALFLVRSSVDTQSLLNLI